MVKTRGFSLIELMIVVAIIAFLAAIAIRSFLMFQNEARESEMKMNLQKIRDCQERYKAEHGVYRELPWCPSEVPGVSSISWPKDTEARRKWDSIGFSPNEVYYQYRVEAYSKGCIVYARGDVDGDGEQVIWSLSFQDQVPESNFPGEY